MDNGGYRCVFELGPYKVFDETDYFAVDINYKHIASFKTLELAQDYIFWKSGYKKNG